MILRDDVYHRSQSSWSSFHPLQCGIAQCLGLNKVQNHLHDELIFKTKRHARTGLCGKYVLIPV
jgi:hypothetical protein